MKINLQRIWQLPALAFLLAAGGCESTRPSAIDTLIKGIEKPKTESAFPSETRLRSPIPTSGKYQKSVANTATLKVFEGLPHPQSEPQLFKNQAKLGTVSEICGYSFYTPAKEVPASATFRKLLSDSKNFGPWYPKFCGDFHPDYGFEWTSSGKSFFALVCFGCHEIIFSDGVQRLRYDLTPEACYELETQLKSYAANRPAKTDFRLDPDAPADPFAAKR